MTHGKLVQQHIKCNLMNHNTITNESHTLSQLQGTRFPASVYPGKGFVLRSVLTRVLLPSPSSDLVNNGIYLKKKTQTAIAIMPSGGWNSHTQPPEMQWGGLFVSHSLWTRADPLCKRRTIPSGCVVVCLCVWAVSIALPGRWYDSPRPHFKHCWVWYSIRPMRKRALCQHSVVSACPEEIKGARLKDRRWWRQGKLITGAACWHAALLTLNTN